MKKYWSTGRIHINDFELEDGELSSAKSLYFSPGQDFTIVGEGEEFAAFIPRDPLTHFIAHRLRDSELELNLPDSESDLECIFQGLSATELNQAMVDVEVKDCEGDLILSAISIRAPEQNY